MERPLATRLETTPAEVQAAYRRVRSRTEALCAPLEIEDYVVQSMPDASPVKWHLAHTSWFFETFVLTPSGAHRGISDPHFRDLFNSYYKTIGNAFARPRRGVLSRPTVREVRAYRRRVDEAIMTCLEADRLDPHALERIVLGLNHEEQHQELLLTDLKHALSHHPTPPAIAAMAPITGPQGPRGWVRFEGGLVTVGHSGEGFAFDNEGPVHQVYLPPYRLAETPITAGEYLAFMEDGGYRTPTLWLSDGWDWVQESGSSAPLYWQLEEDGWWTYTLGGRRPVAPTVPVTHINFFEADAFARWAGKRLPTEAEWEHAAGSDRVGPNAAFQEDGAFHPTGAGPYSAGTVAGLFGDVWEWTASPYRPYPGYRPLAGAVGEYNGKFMNGQYVLRGGSCATPRGHIRRTYRNFFGPTKRWNFMGLRLAAED